MTYAPYTNDRRTLDQGRVLGCFDHAKYGTFFEYADRTSFNGPWAADRPHVLFMSDGSTRFATVKRTVAYVIVDEDGDGSPVVEKWRIKRHRHY